LLRREVTEFKELRVENIHFSYKSDQSPALCFHGELVFEPGKQYAIVGQNRSGKSTLCKLICKLYQPDSGYASRSTCLLRCSIDSMH
jgi:ATP-binding cassette subfamily B protein